MTQPARPPGPGRDPDPERTTDRLPKLLGFTLAALIALSAGIFAGISGADRWFGDRLHGDFWPLDRSTIGPNLLASAIQWAIVVAVTALIYPPLRRWIEHELEHLHAKADHTADLLHHIIEHSDTIPNDDALGRPWHERRPPRGRRR